MTDMKRCPECRQTKPVSEYYRTEGRYDGLSSYCKVCVAEQNRQYRKANLEKITERQVAYQRERHRTDPAYKLVMRFRRRFRNWFKHNGTEKTSSIPQIIGCTPQEMRDHIEAQFQPGMTWENHGFGEGCWHVDHIVPLVSAGNDEAAMFKLWHYSNLQPMWHEENIAKGAKRGTHSGQRRQRSPALSSVESSARVAQPTEPAKKTASRRTGEVAERLNAPVLKCGGKAR